MTEENHCYENALVERVNGILKDEFYLDQTFMNVAHAKRAGTFGGFGIVRQFDTLVVIWLSDHLFSSGSHTKILVSVYT